jgi:hypothetical protein
MRKAVPNKVAKKGINSLLLPKPILGVPFKIIQNPPHLPTIVVIQNMQYEDISHCNKMFETINWYCRRHKYKYILRNVKVDAYINNSFMLTVLDGFMQESIEWLVVFNNNLIVRDKEFHLEDLINQAEVKNSTAMMIALKGINRYSDDMLIVKRSSVGIILAHHYAFHKIYREEDNVSYVEDFIDYMHSTMPNSIHFIDSGALVSKDRISIEPFISYTLIDDYMNLQASHLYQIENE